MRIGIIGGGAAGLAAAFELHRQGHKAIVYENAPALGGQASTFDIGGVPLERGYHHLFVSDVDMVWLIHELGLGSKLAWIESKVGLYRDKRIWPFTTPLDLLRFGAISPLERVRLGATSLLLHRSRDWRQFEPYTAASYLPGKVGQKAYEAVWEPLLRGKFGQYFDQVGMTWLWGKLVLRLASRGKSMAREKLGYPMGGFSEVFSTLGERIIKMGGEVKTSAQVRRITVEEGRTTGLEVTLPDGTTTVEPFDAVIATVPSYVLPSLVPEMPETYLKLLTGVTYLSAVLIILVLDRPLTWAYWINVADRDIPIVAIIEQTNLLPSERYGGRHIVYLSNYLGSENPLYHMGHKELLAEYLPHISKFNPAFDPSWIQDSFYHRIEAAQPIITPNYTKRIPPHRTPFRALYLANTTQVYPEDRGTNYSVRLGRKVARLILKDHGHPVKGKLPTPVITTSITSADEW